MFPLNITDDSRRDALWMKLTREHDPRLYRHSVRVSKLCAYFAAFLHFPQEERQTIARAGLLHDVGKLRVPAAILQKPSQLTEAETEEMRTHPLYGCEMLRASGEMNELVLTVTREHHERLDGSGYPHRITASRISVPVRIVTLCDVFAAITEPRPYATSMRQDAALQRMSEKRTRLDLDLLAQFSAMMTAIQVPHEQCSYAPEDYWRATP